jgi:hypothetical protein
MLNNAKNNAVAMQELEPLLAKHETANMVNFDCLNHHVQCYAYIINICSSHIIASMTSVSKQYLSGLKVPIDPSCMTGKDIDDDLDDDDIDLDHIINALELDDRYEDGGDSKLEEWFEGIKHDPLKHAYQVIYLLCSSNQYRNGFHNFIHDGNE